MKTHLLLITIALGLLSLVSCKDKETNSTSNNHLTVYEVAGLSLELPDKPVIGDIRLPEGLKSLVAKFENYKVVSGATQLSIIHSTYTTAEIDLDDSANGTITQIRSLPGITSFVSTKEPATASGLPARQLAFTYQKDGQSFNHHVLIFIRGMELWQIQIISRGESTAAATQLIRDHVFGSVEIID
ncbi:hypothetical protein JO972_02210 [Verrucomicrobiaceae bacterium 5K15]|uniref:Lipoprotein n=1 Tax=Oceaniferula flava TaxID=2800421 RepID=A0AAE2SA43_9BACT|nr:hypothetical protein [Oceaniferula flavus]MBK1853759.1 hypothetical protein [Oceaniferula flavus]MBM1135066.1 hypothetical protein [Oceaniferula flavus]